MTTPDPFVHLHVASGYSLRHATANPTALVARAAELGQQMLALTDRDGVYGAVRFALAARDAGIGTILGVDLAYIPRPIAELPSVAAAVRRTGAGRLGSGPTLAQRIRRTPARGGAAVDAQAESLPRVVLLARDGRGWAAICRLVSAAHLGVIGPAVGSGSSVGLGGLAASSSGPGGLGSGNHPGTPTASVSPMNNRDADLPDSAFGPIARGVVPVRGRPKVDLDTLLQYAAEGGLVVLLGPDSDVGRCVARRRFDLAQAAIAPFRAALAHDQLYAEIVSHRSRDIAWAPTDVAGSPTRGLPRSSNLAARYLTWAREQRLPTVMSNVVRHLDTADAPIVDVLDAIRRLVPIDNRHLDRANAEGYLKSGAQMLQVAHEVCELAGAADPAGAARQLLANTRLLAESCVLDPATDLGIGSVHVPELAVIRPDLAPPRGVQRSVEEDAVLADGLLRSRCEEALLGYLVSEPTRRHAARERVDAELSTIASLGFAAYFLTVAEVTDLTRSRGIRVAARGSGAGSFVCHLLGISGVDPLAHGLVMERFLSPLRRALPDIDIDVESARREEIYRVILDRFGGERSACVMMVDTYRIRHAIRDVGAALGMARGEIDAFAKSFPHIRAREARSALRDLPELRRSGLGARAATGELDTFLDLVEGMDGLPRHIALHPCGVLLSDGTLLDRTPVEASFAGFPMAQFDKDDVEELGLLKLDVLGIRMQSSMAHALNEIKRNGGEAIVLDEVPRDDPATYSLIQSTHTLGCFQIESPGQRELVGKFAPSTFDDIIIDISLFRPGPVKSDMITPFLKARQGWCDPSYLHDDLRPVLEQTFGVVVFHEQVMGIVSIMTGCSLAQADEIRRSMGSPETQAQVRAWFYPAAKARGYSLTTVEEVWDVLRAFASFGFCKAHAAAFALPTYQSAWLKAHHPAPFLAGVLTHDPGMYPKRLILDDARSMGIEILGVDVNASGEVYRAERVPIDPVAPMPAAVGVPGVPDARGWAIRLALNEVQGISDAEVARIVAGQPYASLADLWSRANPARPVAERLVMVGALDSVYGIVDGPTRRRGRVTRRDLLLQVADLERHTRSIASGLKRTGSTRGRSAALASRSAPTSAVHAAAALSQRPAEVPTEHAVQVALDLGDAPGAIPIASGLADMTAAERVRAEVELLGLDVSRHLVSFYDPFLAEFPGLVRARDLLTCRSSSVVYVAGVKVATQTPPVRSGRRVVFLTLDDSTGPVDATFFEDAQGPYAATLFHSWLLLVRGEVRRTGPRGLSIRATGCWELGEVNELWRAEGMAAVTDLIAASPEPTTNRVRAKSESRHGGTAGGMGQRRRSVERATVLPVEAPDVAQVRRVLLHASGFEQSPYADIKPAGEDLSAGVPTQEKRRRRKDESPDNPEAPAKLWHSSPMSSGW